MANEGKEPQSYGSGSDWSTGTTGQKVNDPKAPPPAEHRDFYDERRESEETSTQMSQGGKVSEVQLAENQQVEGIATGATDPVQSVNGNEGGAKRDSYFKKRDYD